MIEEVRENKKQIFVSQYKAFIARPKEDITDVFERFNKLVSELQSHGKIYINKAPNIKFLLTFPNHLVSGVNYIRDIDLNSTSYDVLYGIEKTHELELVQKRAI